MHESGEFISSTLTLKPVKDDPQGRGSAITYARRYAYASILGLVSDADDDGNRASETTEEYETGIRVPAGYWDLPEDQKQARIGKGYYPKKTAKGWFLFTKEKPSEGFLGEDKANEAPGAPGSFISHDEQLELFRLIKEKNVEMEAFKAFLKGEIKATGTKTIKKADYAKVTEWIISNERDGVESV
jgi:hypothetical protein